MGFFTNFVNYIKSIDMKKYIKKLIPSKEHFDIINKFRKRKKPTRTSNIEHVYTSQNPTTNLVIATTTESPQEPVNFQDMERKSIVAIVEPTFRLDDPTSAQEPDKRKGRRIIYTDRTQIGMNKLINHMNDKKIPMPNIEHVYTSQNPTTNLVIATTTESPQEPVNFQDMERKSIVAIVEPTFRLDDPTSAQEPDKRKGRRIIYTDRTQIGMNKLINHMNDKKIPMPEPCEQPLKEPKRISQEADDVKKYILDSINEIETIRHKIHMKSQIVKRVDCNETDLEIAKEYLTSCMMKIEDVDVKGTSEIETAKEDALYYAKQWNSQLNAQLKVQRDAAEDVYIRVTLEQLDVVKNNINKLASETKSKGDDNTDVIRRLNQYIDVIENIDTKNIPKIEHIKRATLTLAKELIEDVHAHSVEKRTELLEQSNLDSNDIQIGQDHIYDDVIITSSSEYISVYIGDSDSDGDSVSGNAPIDNTDNNIQLRRPSQFIIPDILIDSCEVQKEVVEIDTERNKLPAVHSHAESTNRLKGETPKSIPTDNELKLVKVNLNHFDDELEVNRRTVKTAQTNIINETAINNNRETGNLNNASINDFICMDNDDGHQRSPIQVTHSEPRRVSSVRSSQRQNETALKLSKILKEYVQRQLEDLTEETLSYKGTKNNSDYKRLWQRINRELEALEAMDINNNNTVVEYRWKTQVTHLRKMLSFNAKIWQEQIDNDAKINERKSATVKNEDTIFSHQPIAKVHVRQLVDVQKQNEQEARVKLKADLDNIHKKLAVLSERVFNFCSYQKNQEYVSLEASIYRELNTLKRSNTHKDFPELDLRKLEIEQFGQTWLRELQRRLEEMQIRKYEARVKALW